jgi:hypothetical protein
MISLLLLLYLCFPLTLSSQLYSHIQAQPAQFTGIIVDADSNRIPKVEILIEGGDQKWNLESDSKGEFRLELPRGVYKFQFEKAEFKRHVYTEFCITGGAKISYEFHMEFGECNDCDLIIRDGPSIPSLRPPDERAMEEMAATLQTANSPRRYTYVVRGKVYDEKSHAMAHMTVCWVPGVRPINGQIPCSNSDDDGSFALIVDDVPDKYFVCASTTSSPFVFVGEDPSHRVICSNILEFGAGDEDRKVDLRFAKPRK